MRIHHLSCGTHCPLGGALFDGRSRGLAADLCTHCLLIETEAGLVLVDSGYGMQDVIGRPRRLPHLWPAILRIRLSAEDTALHQVKALGHDPGDVRHIVLTHLDFDHSGGLEDFPGARVHVLAEEFRAASGPLRGLVARQRYRPANFDSVADWRRYETAAGEPWFGFEAVRGLDGLPPEILMVPLAGHTTGHAGIAVRGSEGWLLHAGDAYLHQNQLRSGGRMPPGLALYERIMAARPDAAAANLDRLRELAMRPGEAITIFPAHDSAELERLRAA